MVLALEWAVGDRYMPLLSSCMLTSSTTQSPHLLAAQHVDDLSDCVSWALPRGLGALLVMLQLSSLVLG